MTLVVEDGTGLSTANGYISAAYFTTHFDDRGIDITAYSTADINAAIVRATDYVDKRFGPKFRGFKQSRSQALEWPRFDAFDNDEYMYFGVDLIPRALKKGVAEYALLAAQMTNLLPTPAQVVPTVDPATGEVTTAASGAVTYQKNKVGPIESNKAFADMSKLIAQYRSASSSVTSSFNLPEYPVADEWLRELVRNGQSVKLGRA